MYTVKTIPTDLSVPRVATSRREAERLARAVTVMYGTTLNCVYVTDRAGHTVTEYRRSAEGDGTRWCKVVPGNYCIE